MLLPSFAYPLLPTKVMWLDLCQSYVQGVLKFKISFNDTTRYVLIALSDASFPQLALAFCLAP